MSKLFKEIGKVEEKEYFDLYTTEDMVKHGIAVEEDSGYSLEAVPMAIGGAIAAAIAAIGAIIYMIIKYIDKRASNITDAENQVLEISKNFDGFVRKKHDEWEKHEKGFLAGIIANKGGWKMRDLLIFQKKITEGHIQEAIKEDIKHVDEYTAFIKEIDDNAIKKLPELIEKILSTSEAKAEETTKAEEHKKALEELETFKAKVKEIVDKHEHVFKFERTDKILKILKPDFSHKFIDTKKATQDEIRGSLVGFNESFNAAIKVANEKVDITEAIINAMGVLAEPKAEQAIPSDDHVTKKKEELKKFLDASKKSMEELENKINTRYKNNVVTPAGGKSAKDAINIIRSTVNLSQPLNKAIYDIYLSHIGLYRRYQEVAAVSIVWSAVKDKGKKEEEKPDAGTAA